MSAAPAGVSAIAISNEVANAPASDVLIAVLRMRPTPTGVGEFAILQSGLCAGPPPETSRPGASAGSRCFQTVRPGLQAEHEHHRRRRRVLEFGGVVDHVGRLPCTREDGDILL